MNKEEIKKMTFKEKVDNFWYYYKWHFFAVLVVLSLVIYGVYNAVTKVDVDIVVYYLSEDAMYYDEQEAAIKKALEPYVRDYTGDGTVRIEVQNFYIGPQYDIDLVKKNLRDFSNAYTAGGVMLILADDFAVKQISEKGWYGDISDITDNTEYDGTVWNAEGSDFAKLPVLENWYEPMYWGVRVFNEKSIISLSKTKDKEFAYAKEILSNIINNKPVNG